jgi:hypothetical protein
MNKEQGRTRKFLASMLVLGLLAGLATIASFAAFSSTTSNGVNDFDAGTVYISDNDGDSVMYDLTNQKPLDSVEKCIKVTYTGSLDAAVTLYGSAPGTFGDYVNLTIEQGALNSDTFPDCTSFVADGAAIYTGTLGDFAANNSDFTTGLPTTDTGGGAWQTGDARVYRFTVTLQDDNAANGETAPLGTDDHSFTWEAQNI